MPETPHKHPHNARRNGVAAGVIFLVLGLGIGYAIGVGHGYAAFAQTDASEPAGVDFSPVWKAWETINQEYVPVVVASSSPIATSSPDADQTKVYGMIEGLANSLNDPYSYFLPPTENRQFSDDMSGSFGGVGMQIDMKNNILTVISPLKGTPAEKAGIQGGDQVLKIDGTDTAGMTVDAAVQKIRGPVGSTVTLTVLRSGWQAPREIKVRRDVISVPEVETSARPDGVFVIQVITFTSNSPDLFRAALRKFIESGDSKLVLDLRGNPGGYLEAAVDIASWFLPSGNVIVTEDYAGHADNIVHRSLGYNVFSKNLQMVILVDKGSASAAEILADALHYYGIGKLVGETTYGKGSVQELVPITADSSLKLTVARWLGPDQKPIPTSGIVPDVSVPITDADVKSHTDSQLAKAVQLLGGNPAASSTMQVIQ